MNQKGFNQIPLLILIAAVLVGAVAYGYFFYDKGEEGSKNTNTVVKNTNTTVNVNENTNTSLFNTNTSIVDTTGWKTYTRDDAGFSFMYPSNWSPDDRSTDDEVVFDIGIAESREAVKAVVSSQTIEEWKTGLNLDAEVILDETNLMVGDKTGLRIDTSEFGTTYIGLQNGDYFITITTGGRMVDLGITSTFRFTSTDETASWKTYSSAEGSLSFKYPKDWYISGEALVNGVYSWHLTNYDVSSVVARGGLDPGMLKVDFSIYPNDDNQTTDTVLSCENSDPDYTTIISCDTSAINDRIYKKRIQDSLIEGSARSIELGTVANDKKYFITGMAPSGDEQQAGLEDLESVFNTLVIE